ncbi:type II toxin-antitoxin system PemK/MazF family toxin [Nocardia neocaledoniensis]|uniref:type II toxin-antitoxin system PemK/MazF family toxin n=1 Tax=Nocardia neocaledoniensis TaxID=236511 RepID=UPI00245412A1|nr:type II toxin-antitoxin system PemK/MazF family toxin [Nocardia neocaledoniensis]
MMRRGDILLVEFDPVRPDEANKVRPAVVVSNDGANRSAEKQGRGVISVLPVTTNVEKVYSFQVLLEDVGLRTESKVQTEQIRSVSISRVRRTIGRVPAATMAEVDRVLRLHLGL